MKTSGSKRIAKRYVKALFDVVQAESALGAVENDLNVLAGELQKNKDFQHFLNNPLLSQAERAGTMSAILAKMQAHKITKQFIDMLIALKRLAILPEIMVLFGQWAGTARGELRAELITAAPLKAQEVAMVGERLGRAYGKTMKLEVRQNPELLGGVVVKIGSLQLDSSLAGKLSRLSLKLKVA